MQFCWYCIQYDTKIIKITQLIFTMNTYSIKLITRPRLLSYIIDFLLMLLGTVRFNTIISCNLKYCIISLEK